MAKQNNDAKSRRRTVLIDRPVQVGLVARLTLQWFTLFVAAVVVLPLVRAILLGDIATPIAERASRAGVDAIILGSVFLVLLPYFIYDTFRATNRFAGPMYRLHQSIRATGRGEPFRPINLRKGDYWHDVANDFNEMVERLERSRDAGEAGAREQEDPVTIGG
jgi:hypothetical protein